MKKYLFILSAIVAISLMLFTGSCREDEEDQGESRESLPININWNNFYHPEDQNPDSSAKSRAQCSSKMDGVVDTVRVAIYGPGGEELASRDFNYSDCEGTVTSNLAGDKRIVTCIGLKDGIEIGWGQTQQITIYPGTNEPVTVEVCPVWYQDADGDLYSDGTSIKQCDDPGAYYYQTVELTAAKGDCDDSDAAIHPGVVDDCDGINDDCDGSVDEDYHPVTTTCGAGTCITTGTTSCIDGVVEDSCKPGSGAAEDTTCDGVDDDCDGIVDDDYKPVKTTCGSGHCTATGTTSCVDGKVIDSCRPAGGTDKDNTCDGVDDDCDGAVDEDYKPVKTTCGSGPCKATGTTSCVDGKVENSCTPGSGAAKDTTCDGVDDDCDGAVDDDYESVATTCGAGPCSSTGITSCVDGKVKDSCKPGKGAAEDTTCDGVDDDCDDAVDDDYKSVVTTCGIGPCSATGTTSCVDGKEKDSCTPGSGAAEDTTCDGVDDDCDGKVDEDFIPTPTTCGLGECAATGSMECQSGEEVNTCIEGDPTAEVCEDGLDNDCDGFTDGDDPDCAI